MRILVVDDEFVALTKMKAILSQHGECDVATHGPQALEMFCAAALEGHPYSLITIDIEMPEMRGFELLKRITEEEKRRRMVPAKKLMVSADSSVTSVTRAAHGRCDDFIVKPARKEVVLQKLHRLGLIRLVEPADPEPLKGDYLVT